VSAEFFSAAGATAAIGRVFTPEEDRPGGPKLAVVSYGLWKRRWGGDAGLLGRTLFSIASLTL
jgi:hypothetical protein